MRKLIFAFVMLSMLALGAVADGANPDSSGTNSKFKPGDRVLTTTDVKVRSDPGLASKQIDSMDDGNSMIKGNMGTVLDGPSSVDGYNWWKVSYDIGITGWSAENYLELVSDAPQQPDNFAQWSNDAINWATNKDRIDSNKWNGECLRFVSNAFRQEDIAGESVYSTALNAARNLYRFNQEQGGWQHAPKGTLIFFDAKGNNPDGHIGIYLGDGKNIINAYGTVQEIAIEDAMAKGDVGKYIGWSYPPEAWRPETSSETKPTVSTAIGTATDPYSIDFDLRNMSGFSDDVISASDIEAFIQEKYPNSLMLNESGISSCFISAGQSNNVNPAFLVATACLEGGFGTAGWAASHPECHNTFGYGIPSGTTQPDDYNCADSWCAMIQRVASDIAHGDNYYAQGLHTVSQVRAKYAANPNADSIASLMNELYVFSMNLKPISHNAAVAASNIGSQSNTATGTILQKLVHDGAVKEIVFSPDGTKLATASEDKTARIWDVATGTLLQKLVHDDTPSYLAFTPNGSKLVDYGGPVDKPGSQVPSVFVLRGLPHRTQGFMAAPPELRSLLTLAAPAVEDRVGM